MKFLIWSIEHRAWWAANESGYSETLFLAGLYTREDATRIVEHANVAGFNECAIPVAAFEPLTIATRR